MHLCRGRRAIRFFRDRTPRKEPEAFSRALHRAMRRRMTCRSNSERRGRCGASRARACSLRTKVRPALLRQKPIDLARYGKPLSKNNRHAYPWRCKREKAPKPAPFPLLPRKRLAYLGNRCAQPTSEPTSGTSPSTGSMPLSAAHPSSTAPRRGRSHTRSRSAYVRGGSRGSFPYARSGSCRADSRGPCGPLPASSSGS